MKKIIRLFSFFLFIFMAIGISPVIADYGFQCQIPGQTIPVKTSVSDDGQWVFAGSPASGVISLFYQNGDVVWAYRTNHTITDVVVSADGEYYYAASIDGEVHCLNRSGTHLWTKTNAGCYPQVVLSPSGLSGLIFNQNNPGQLSDYNFHRFSLNGSITEEGFSPRIYAAAIPDGKEYTLVRMARESQSALEIYSRDKTQLIENTSGYWLPPEITSDGITVLVPHATSYDLYDANGTQYTGGNRNYRISSVAISPEGDSVVVGTQFDLERYTRNGTRAWHFLTRPEVTGIALSHEGEKIATVAVYSQTAAAITSHVSLLSASGSQLWRNTVNDNIDDISISRNGKTVVAGSFNDTVYFFMADGAVRAVRLDSLRIEPLPPTPSPTIVYWTYIPTNTAGIMAGMPVAAAFVAGIIVCVFRKLKEKM